MSSATKSDLKDSGESDNKKCNISDLKNFTSEFLHYADEREKDILEKAPQEFYAKLKYLCVEYIVPNIRKDYTNIVAEKKINVRSKTAESDLTTAFLAVLSSAQNKLFQFSKTSPMLSSKPFNKTIRNKTFQQSIYIFLGSEGAKPTGSDSEHFVRTMVQIRAIFKKYMDENNIVLSEDTFENEDGEIKDVYLAYKNTNIQAGDVVFAIED